MTERAPPVLRVLNGRLAGAEKALPEAGGRLSVGHQFWQDVTLREPGVRGIAVEIAVQDGTQVQVSVLSGTIALLGSKIEAGGTAVLPPYVPLSIGGTVVAWGEPDSARWSEAGALADVVPLPPPVPPTPQDQALAIADRARDNVRQVMTGPRIAALAGVALLVIGIGAAGPALDAFGLRASDPERVARALADAGLPGLSATSDSGSGGVIVNGIVADEAARARAQDVLRAEHVPGTVDVRTSAELASSAADVARLRGVEATARPIGRTAIELHVTPMAPPDRQQLVQAIRSDVGGIGRLALVADLVPKDDVPIRSVADATKKVSTVVAGDPAYIRTVDGARYFAGAMMPSGHRLVAIKDQTVVLERNGRQTMVRF